MFHPLLPTLQPDNLSHHSQWDLTVAEISKASQLLSSLSYITAEANGKANFDLARWAGVKEMINKSNTTGFLFKCARYYRSESNEELTC